MSWIKATLSFINARRHPDEVTREVETELRFHIEMRTRANVEQGMKTEDAQRAAVQRFGDFERVKTDCCEIRRNLPFKSMPLRMGLHIAIATLTGFAALWAVNLSHHNFTGVMRQLIAIGVLTYLFIVVQRDRAKRRADSEHLSSVFAAPSDTFRANHCLRIDISDAPSARIRGYDEQGRTPVERVFKSD